MEFLFLIKRALRKTTTGTMICGVVPQGATTQHPLRAWILAPTPLAVLSVAMFSVDDSSGLPSRGNDIGDVLCAHGVQEMQWTLNRDAVAGGIGQVVTGILTPNWLRIVFGEHELIGSA
jgi:hypothetical protein